MYSTGWGILSGLSTGSCCLYFYHFSSPMVACSHSAGALLAGSSFGIPLHAGELAVPCERGTVRKGHFHRSLEFSERHFQSFRVASYYCGPYLTCPTFHSCKGTRAPANQVVNLWHCHYGSADNRQHFYLG